jgi:hypothetical protein
MEKQVCGRGCEIYSRITGYHRPLKNWNAGKQNEFTNRKCYKITVNNNKIVSSDDIIEESRVSSDRTAICITA